MSEPNYPPLLASIAKRAKPLPPVGEREIELPGSDFEQLQREVEQFWPGYAKGWPDHEFMLFSMTIKRTSHGRP